MTIETPIQNYTRWFEADEGGLWWHEVNGIWTGFTIAYLQPYFGNPNQPRCFHVRYSPLNQDLDDMPTLEKAKTIAQLYYGAIIALMSTAECAPNAIRS